MLARTTVPPVGQASQMVTVGGSGFFAGTIPVAGMFLRLEPVTPGAGPAADLPALGIVGSTGTTRRISFRIPTTISVAVPTNYWVSVSGTTATGVPFASANKSLLVVNPPAVITSLDPSHAAPGATLGVAITGQYTDFYQGATKASFGPGISVGGAAEGALGPVTVTSKTTATALVTVAANASPGPRSVSVATGAQQASLDQGFTVDGAQANRNPLAVIAGPTAGEAGQPLTFSAAGSSDPDGDALTYSWNFGDGTPAGSGVAPSHAYAAEGTFTVTLTVSDGKGGTGTSTAMVTVSAPANRPPVARITAPAQANTSEALTFDASSSSDPDNDPLTGYAWTFGDGGSATGASVAHAYATPGSYTVRLTVTDSHGSASTAEHLVTIVQPNRPPIGNPGGPYTGTAGQPLTVTGTATDPDGDLLLTFGWTFGDGTPAAAGASTSHTYAAEGAYTITLTVTDSGGLVHVITTTATIAASNHAPTANPGGPYSGMAGSVITFNGARSSDPDQDALSYLWDFGDGATATGAAPAHAYALRGSYTVTLTVADDRGGSHSATTTAVVSGAPTASAGGPYTATTGQAITLDGSGSTDPDGDTLIYSWNFGDGTPAGSGMAPSHAYAAEGTFTVTLTVNDGKGGTGTSTAMVTVSAPANRPPVARFTAPASGDVNHDVTMDAAASSDPDGDALTFSWDFGDLSPAGSGRTAAHRYGSLGVFTMTLTVSDGQGGVHSAQQAITIANRPPVARITAPAQGDTNQAIAFDASPSTDPDGDVLTYAWDFGDGSAGASGAAASHRYATLGTFTVRLTATDAFGATHSVEQPISVANHTPVARFTAPATGQVGQDVAFDASGSTDPDHDVLTYAWQFGDASAPGNGATTTHRYTARGRYVVRLTVSDAHGGSHATEREVSIANQAPVARIAAAPTGGINEGLAFDGTTSSDADQDALTYAWDFGDGTAVVRTASATHSFASPASYTVRLTVTDGYGGTHTAQHALTIANRAPSVGLNGPYSVTVGHVLALAAAGSDPDGDPLTYRWDFDDTTSGTGAATSHAWAAAGSVRVTVTATDAWGATASAEATVNVTQPENQAPTAHAGGPYGGEPGIPVPFDGTRSSDPEQQMLTYAWTFGDGATGAGATPTHAYAAPGSYPVTLRVTDPLGLTHDATSSVTIGLAVDRIAPVVSLGVPKEALPGSQVTISAQAADNVGVASVTLTAEGFEPTQHAAAPYERTLTIPSVAQPGSTIRFTATAIDPGGNAGSAQAVLTIAATPDIEKPVVTLGLPATAAPSATIRLTAAATDNRAVTSVVFLAGDTAIATVTQAPYEATWPVPAGAAPGATFTFVARATDAAGNSGDANGTLTVVAAPDEAAPTVSLSAPAEIQAGATLTLTATASDNVGVSSVWFLVDGVRVATLTGAPYEARFVVPASARGGSVLQLEARAIDFTGLQAGASGQARVTGTAVAAGQGVLTGEVYDDTTGLPIEGAVVTLTGFGANGTAYSQATTSDRRGRYSVAAPEGDALVTITRPGWTIVDRPSPILAGQAQELIDARLTRLAAPGAELSAVVGGRITNGSLALTVPAGALNANAALALTAVGQQGLQGTLPAGWSPVAVVDVTPHGAAFDVAAVLEVPNTVQVPAGTPLVAAIWDGVARQWRCLGTSQVTTGNVPLQASLSFTGQVAWLLADTLPLAPSQPAAGDPLTGVAPSTVPADALVTIAPQPRVLFYQPGVKSEVSNAITTSAPLSSGVLIAGRIDESYRFDSGAEMHPDPFVQDLVFYQVSGQPTTLAARHQVSPSEVFDALSLERGTIGVELHVPGANRLVGLVGPNGGTVNSPTGERLEVPPGACVEPTPIQLARLALPETGLTLPAGLEFVGGVTASFAGSFGQPALLSMTRPDTLTSAAGVLLVRIVEIRGESRLVLTARARIDGDRLVSDVTLPGSDATFEGPRVAGRYLFLRTQAATGFVAGRVLAGAAPTPGALVSGDTLPIVSLSSPAGVYVSAAPGGSVNLSALDLEKNDSGSAAATVVPAQVVALDLALLAQPPRVLSIAPGDGASNVPLSDPVVVTFSEPVLPASVTPQAVVLAGPDATPVAATLSLSSNNTVATLRPAVPLAANTQYAIAVAATITDLAGYTLGTDVIARFTSLDTAPPPMPAAGSLAATIPGGDGYTTITGTQGTAGLHDRVVIVNLTDRSSTPVLLDSNGGFSVKVAARVGDALRLSITDHAGNETAVDLPPFRQVNTDGSVSQAVGSGAGRVEGPGGLVVDVQAGTFPDGAVVTVKPVSEAEFPVTLTPDQATVYSYAGGLTIDFGGATPQHYVNVSIPAGPNDKPGDQWMVSQVVQVDGEPKLNVVDTAKLIDGRIKTSSPPCPGVLAAGMLGIHKSLRMTSLIYGTGAMRQTADLYRAIATQPFGPSGTFVQPGGQYFDDTYNFCLPVLAGRVSISLNTVDVLVPIDGIRPTDRQITVENKKTTRANKWTFSREELFIVQNVPGAPADVATVEAEFSGGTTSPLAFIAQAGHRNTTDVRIAFTKLPENATGIVISSVSGAGATITKIARSSLDVVLRVQGGFTDPFDVMATSGTSGTPVSIRSGVRASSLGPEPLILRAQKGTIDPNAAEIAAWNATHGPDEQIPSNRVRTTVELVNGTVNSRTAVPDTAIVEGGITFGFYGELADSYSVTVNYEAPTPSDSLSIHTFTLTVSTSAHTVKVITLPSPPPEDSLELPTLSDDTDEPDLAGSLLEFMSFDPSKLLTFTFDEPMKASSMQNNFKLLDSSNTPVHGKVIVSAGSTTLTFVPDAPLKLSTRYTASFVGVTDLKGNEVAGTHRTFVVETATPHVASTLTFGNGLTPGNPKTGLMDLQFMTVTSGATTTRYAVGVTGEQDGYKVVTFNVDNPTAPTFVAGVPGGYWKKRLLIVPNVDLALAAKDKRGDGTDPTDGNNPCQAGNRKFVGTLGVATNANTYSSAVQFFDLTDPTKPCMAGMQMLTANPDQLSSYTQTGTLHVLGFARAVAVLPTSQGLTAYTAVSGAGLFATDISKSIPEVNALHRTKDPMIGGDYVDVASMGNRLLALNAETRELQVVDPNLAVISTLTVSDRPDETPRTMTYQEGVPWDVNGDGAIASGEYLNLAVVTTAGTVKVVDATRPESMQLTASIPIGGDVIRAVELDPKSRRLWVVTPDKLHLVDLAGVQATGLVDADGDGKDDRIAWTHAVAESPYGVRVDDRGMVFVSTGAGLQVVSLEPANVRGEAKYRHYPVNDTDGVKYAGGGSLKPIRGALVRVLKSPSYEFITSTTTDDLGRFAVAVPRNMDVAVVVPSALGSETAASVDLRNVGPGTAYGTAEGERYFVLKDLHTSATGVDEVSLTAEAQWSGAGYTGDRLAAPFAILDTIYGAMRAVREADPSVTFKPLTVRWGPWAGGGAAFFRASEMAIHLRGRQDDNTDEYDSCVVLHEWIHYLTHTQSRSDSVGGNHWFSDHLDPRVAFNEGLATAFGNILANEKVYVDTAGPRQQPGNVLYVENGGIKSGGAAEPPGDDGYFSEFTNVALLWDLYDETGAEGKPNPDNVSLGLKPLFDVFKGPQKTSVAPITTFSFLHQLLAQYSSPSVASTKANIEALAKSWNVAVPATLYGDLVLADVARDGTVQSTFTSGALAGQPLATLATYAPTGKTNTAGDYTGFNNKLYNRAFLRVVVPAGAEGNHELRLSKITLGTGKLTAQYYHNGNAAGFVTSTTDVTLFEKDMAAGTWIIEVMTHQATRFEVSLVKK